MLHLQTQRLSVRPLKLSDLEDFHSYHSLPEVMIYQGLDVMNLQQAEEFITTNASKKFGKAGEWTQWAIEEKSTHRVIGDCALQCASYDTRIVRVGITISPHAQKQGFAKETLLGLLAFLFESHQTHRVEGIVDVKNKASIRLLESVGFRREGHFVENKFFNEEWGSEFSYAMLKREWLDRKASHT